MASEGKVVVKDSGFSWIILAASFVTQMIIFGLILCFGIYFVTLLEEFKCTKSEVAVIGSIAYGTKCLTGLLSSILYRKFGCRMVVMMGGLISSVGCFLSYFATDLGHLYITYGFLNGLGLGLAYTPTLGILPDYFDRYRYFATAFATVGSATGTFLFQPIFLHLIRTYAWQGSMLLNAGLALQIVVCGSLMRSRTLNSNIKFKSLIETTLYKDVKFWLLVANCVLWGGSIYVVFSMVNTLVIAHGVTKTNSALLASLIGLSNVLGRLSSSLIGHYQCTNRPLFYAVVTTLFSCGILAATQAKTFWMFAVSLMVFGYAFGSMLSQLAGVIMDLFGVAKLVNGIGYTMFGVGLGGMLLPPLAGWMADNYNVKSSFYLAFAFGMAAACLAYINFYSKQKQLAEEERNKGEVMETMGDTDDAVKLQIENTS